MRMGSGMWMEVQWLGCVEANLAAWVGFLLLMTGMPHIILRALNE